MGEISLYFDHDGNGLEEWWDDEINLVVSEDESGLEDEGTFFTRNVDNVLFFLKVKYVSKLLLWVTIASMLILCTKKKM